MTDWLRGESVVKRLTGFFKDPRRCREDYDEAWGLGKIAHNELVLTKKALAENEAALKAVREKLGKEYKRIELHVQEARDRLTKYPASSLRRRIDGIIGGCRFNGFVAAEVEDTLSRPGANSALAECIKKDRAEERQFVINALRQGAIDADTDLGRKFALTLDKMEAIITADK